MSKRLLTPVNRRLVLSLKEEVNVTDSGVLLPEDFTRSEAKYKRATLEAAAMDCSSVFRAAQGMEIFVESSMIEKVSLGSEEVCMILENYVLGICAHES